MSSLITTHHPRETVLTWRVRTWDGEHGRGIEGEADLEKVEVAGVEAHEPTWYRELHADEWQRICDERDEQIDFYEARKGEE